MFGSRNFPSVPAATAPEPLAIELTSEELEVFEQLVEHQKTVLQAERWDYTPSLAHRQDDLLALLYRRAGAASVTGGTGIPLLVDEIDVVESSVRVLEQYRKSSPEAIAAGRTLLRRLHFQAGRATAVRSLGGIPTLPTPGTPRPALG